jgi:hypothetical protein
MFLLLYACLLPPCHRASFPHIVPSADHARRSPAMLALRLLRAVLRLPLGGSSREHPYIYAIPHCPLDLYLSSRSIVRCKYIESSNKIKRYVVQTASLPSKPRMFATSIGEVRCPSHQRESPRPRKVRCLFGAPWGSFWLVPECTNFGIPVPACPRPEICTAVVAASSYGSPVLPRYNNRRLARTSPLFLVPIGGCRRMSPCFLNRVSYIPYLYPFCYL